jgi:hypothetical protein
MSYLKYILTIFVLLFAFLTAFAQPKSLHVSISNSTTYSLNASLKSKAVFMQIVQPTPPVPVSSNSIVALTIANLNSNKAAASTLQIITEDNSGECDFDLSFNPNTGKYNSNLTTSTGVLAGNHCSATWITAGISMDISIK